MSFQTYLYNIKLRAGKTPEDFKKLAEQKGRLQPSVKSGEIVAWLKEDFGLGDGHSMAIYAVFKDLNNPGRSTEDVVDRHSQAINIYG